MAGAPEHERIAAESIPETPEEITGEFRADMVAA
jgi:hypothetical protein